MYEIHFKNGDSTKITKGALQHFISKMDYGIGVDGGLVVCFDPNDEELKFLFNPKEITYIVSIVAKTERKPDKSETTDIEFITQIEGGSLPVGEFIMELRRSIWEYENLTGYTVLDNKKQLLCITKHTYNILGHFVTLRPINSKDTVDISLNVSYPVFKKQPPQ